MNEVINYVMDTPGNTNPNVLKGLLDKSVGPAGPSSLADLSDVEIDTSEHAKQLLKYNASTEKWENVSPVRAVIANPDPTSNQGSVFVTDTEEFASAHSIMFRETSQEAYLFSSIIESAIANGQFQMDDLPKQTFRNLVLIATQAVFFNFPLYLAIGGVVQINTSLSLDSATSDYATFVGTFVYNSKFYRITLTVFCPDSAAVATVLAKAEELMTFTEPTTP